MKYPSFNVERATISDGVCSGFTSQARPLLQECATDASDSSYQFERDPKPVGVAPGSGSSVTHSGIVASNEILEISNEAT